MATVRHLRDRLAASALTMLLAWAFLATDPASADELVKFDGGAYVPSQLQQRLARARGDVAKGPPGAPVEGYLSKPDGNGPFPAVILLHGCAGLSKAVRISREQQITGWGYVALNVDSFTSRGIKQECVGSVPPADRLADAWGALRYLSKLPFVDPRRIAVVGWSQGGIVTLEIASENPFQLFENPDSLSFKAAVAYYPACGDASDQMTVPTLIMIGELDDWLPAKDCERLMQRQAGKGATIKLITYPGAYHAFDLPELGDGVRSYGHWLKYDAEAARLSIEEVHEFLARNLARD
jgi:dienelactone hydrolase